MKNIYIILSQSGTWISKMLKFFTRAPYNHASLALDISLEEFFSFGRKKVTNFLMGGFVVEHKNKGVYEKFAPTPCKIIELPVTDEQYHLIKQIINEFVKNTEIYHYDFVNVPLVNTPFHIIRRNRFFCSQFVAYALNSAGIKTVKPPEHIAPIDFLKLENSKVIYTGILQQYEANHGE